MAPSSKYKTSKSKAPPAPPTSTSWNHEFDTLRREDLFRNPPKDHTAYPALKEAVAPHVESFNAVFEEHGLINKALKDIGTISFLDGDARAPTEGKNKLSIRIKQVYLGKSMLPDTNKTTFRNREVLPSECRERHVTYRGLLTAKFEYRINDGDPYEFTRDLGKFPLMLMVGTATRIDIWDANSMEVK
jgi:DNA-directed RNA polymerase I subunit RPA2